MSDQITTPPVAPVPPTSAAPVKKGFAVTALVLGIIAIVGSWMPLLNVGSMFIGFIGLVFGVIATVQAFKGTAAGKGMAIAGTVLSALAIIFAMMVNSAAVSAVDEALDEARGDISAQAPADDASDDDTTGDVEGSTADEDVADEEPAEAATTVGTFENPAAIGDGTVWTFTQGGNAWEIVFESVEVVEAWAGDGDVAVLLGTATPTEIADGATSSWASFPSFDWFAGGTTVEDTYSMVDSDAFEGYRTSIDLKGTVGTEMKFRTSVGLPDGVTPELIEVSTMFGSEDLYLSTGL
ncbi:DUF4190 domain-containing protein [Demequina pelophila]|uniref:DUF4190 domain-containing protein n=1 Tax=Demequina pelophila TaxID=1638984 RepID=UPI0007826668|nr:DUF4190 domain-containing protein [Demequina pelophila]